MCPHTMKATDYAGAVFCCDCGLIVSASPAHKAIEGRAAEIREETDARREKLRRALAGPKKRFGGP